VTVCIHVRSILSSLFHGFSPGKIAEKERGEDSAVLQKLLNKVLQQTRYINCASGCNDFDVFRGTTVKRSNPKMDAKFYSKTRLQNTFISFL
jgi:hypothetical protein